MHDAAAEADAVRSHLGGGAHGHGGAYNGAARGVGTRHYWPMWTLCFANRLGTSEIYRENRVLT
jgi:hypothetical protein